MGLKGPIAAAQHERFCRSTGWCDTDLERADIALAVIRDLVKADPMLLEELGCEKVEVTPIAHEEAGLWLLRGNESVYRVCTEKGD